MARWSVLHLITLAGLQLSQTLAAYISLPTCWKFQLQSFSLKSQPLESQPIAKVCQNGHLLVMQPLSHGKENGEATGLVASAWNQQLGRSKGGKSHQAAWHGLIVSPCAMVRWGEADDSLRLRYAAPTRLILRRSLERIRKDMERLWWRFRRNVPSGGGQYSLYIFKLYKNINVI